MPGKTTLAMSELDRKEIASMRPQRNAGENAKFINLILSMPFASMRPQRNAGENLLRVPRRGPISRASMRPQRNAGENTAAVDSWPVVPLLQ